MNSVSKWDSPTYKTWHGMKHRCENPSNPGYKNYGGRGIKVCDRWLNSFDAFLEDMGERPGINYSLDRINNDLGYFPENCRWATKAEQQRNTSRNRRFTYNGETLCVADWAKKFGMPYDVLRARLMNPNWTIEDAFTIPYKKGCSFSLRVLKDEERPYCCNRPMMIVNTGKIKPSRERQYYGCWVCKTRVPGNYPDEMLGDIS